MGYQLKWFRNIQQYPLGYITNIWTTYLKKKKVLYLLEIVALIAIYSVRSFVSGHIRM